MATELTQKQKNAIDRECDSYVAELLTGEHTGHDITHARRVKITGLQIAQREKADPFLVSLIALLHDVDDPKIFPDQEGKLIHAEAFLRPRIGELTDSILDDIAKISFKGTGATKPDSLEGRIVQDADRLEAMGFLGIGRAFAYGGRKDRPMMDDTAPRSSMTEKEYRSTGSTINHFYEKLFKLKGLLNTETAKRMASYRDSVMRDFVAGFESEWRNGSALEVENSDPSEILLDELDGSHTIIVPCDCVLIYLSGQPLVVQVNGQTVRMGRKNGEQRLISLVAGTQVTLTCPLDYTRFLLLDI